MPEIVFRSSLALAPAGGNRDGCGSGFWPPQLIDNSKCLGWPMGAGVPVIKLISNLHNKLSKTLTTWRMELPNESPSATESAALRWSAWCMVHGAWCPANFPRSVLRIRSVDLPVGCAGMHLIVSNRTSSHFWSAQSLRSWHSYAADFCKCACW